MSQIEKNMHQKLTFWFILLRENDTSCNFPAFLIGVILNQKILLRVRF